MARTAPNYVAIALLLFGFLIVALLAFQEIWQPRAQEEESFMSKAVTRATDCSCLPGYIPSKTKGGVYVCLKLGEPQTTRACY